VRYPKYLKPGDRIGVIAPSFGCTIEPYASRFKEALRIAGEKGYKPVVGENVFCDEGIGKSNTSEKCGAEINDFFLNDRSDVIISAGGGETMIEDLNHVDFEAIKKAEPKWFLGYSDNTNLTFLLPTICDTAAIYGPCAGAFGRIPYHKSIKDTVDVLTGSNLTVRNYDKWEKDCDEYGDDALAPYNLTEDYDMSIYGAEKAEFSGRLIGGCLDCLIALCGTKFGKVHEFTERYKDDGIIWFMEACELSPIKIRLALWQLENAGWFENVKGFIFGRPMCIGETAFGMDHINAVTEILKKHNVPIILDADIGHLPPMMPLISGAYADVCAISNDKEKSLTITMQTK